MAPPPDPAHSAPALVGRDREQATLRDHLAAARAGHGGLVLIGGEAGIGKTALAEDLLAAAASQGAQVLVGRCYDLSETPPYGPWVEALARAPRGDGLPTPPDLAGGTGATSQPALFAQVRDHLAALAAARPVVVVLDDLHWADPASLGLWLLVEGRWAELRRALPARAGPEVMAWAELARRQGAADEVRAALQGGLPGGAAQDPGDTHLDLSLRLQRVAAGVALDAGDLPAAEAWLAAHDRWLAWSGAVLGQSEGQALWAAYHRATGDGALARRHADHALAEATAPRQPLALLAAHRLLGELATAAGDFTAAQAHLDESLALAEACAAPYERALTLLALAELHAATDDRAGAQATLDAARALLAPLEARPALARADALADRLAATPAPVTLPALPFGLTAREAAVLRLMVAGLTNAQAAARLFVTPRTIGTHLTSIYTKLGVDGRADAIRVALDHGLR